MERHASRMWHLRIRSPIRHAKGIALHYYRFCNTLHSHFNDKHQTKKPK